MIRDRRMNKENDVITIEEEVRNIAYYAARTWFEKRITDFGVEDIERQMNYLYGVFKRIERWENAR